jgi:hypothetical protein
MLEPCAVKVARTVLRGGARGNSTSLPDAIGTHEGKANVTASVGINFSA